MGFWSWSKGLFEFFQRRICGVCGSNLNSHRCLCVCRISAVLRLCLFPEKMGEMTRIGKSVWRRPSRYSPFPAVRGGLLWVWPSRGIRESPLCWLTLNIVLTVHFWLFFPLFFSPPLPSLLLLQVFTCFLLTTPIRWVLLIVWIKTQVPFWPVENQTLLYDVVCVVAWEAGGYGAALPWFTPMGRKPLQRTSSKTGCSCSLFLVS